MKSMRLTGSGVSVNLRNKRTAAVWCGYGIVFAVPFALMGVGGAAYMVGVVGSLGVLYYVRHNALFLHIGDDEYRGKRYAARLACMYGLSVFAPAAGDGSLAYSGGLLACFLLSHLMELRSSEVGISPDSGNVADVEETNG